MAERSPKKNRGEVLDHADMADSFDAHLRNRNEIDLALLQLRVASDSLRASVSDEPPAADPSVVDAFHRAELLRDEVEVRREELSTVRRILQRRNAHVVTLEAELAALQSAASARRGLDVMVSHVEAIAEGESRIRDAEDRLLDISNDIRTMVSEVQRRSNTAKSDREVLASQVQELTRKGDDLEAQLAAVQARQASKSSPPSPGVRGASVPADGVDPLDSTRRPSQEPAAAASATQQQQFAASGSTQDRWATSGSTRGLAGFDPLVVGSPGQAGFDSLLISPAMLERLAASGSLRNADTPGAANTVALLWNEIQAVAAEIEHLKEVMRRDEEAAAARPPASPLERMQSSPGEAPMLMTDTLIRIMQLLKATLFNLSHDLSAIESSVLQLARDRNAADDLDLWREDVVGDALTSAALYMRQPYDRDVMVAERMVKKLRRLVIVCDTVEGLTATWVIDFAERRGISLEVAHFYEVAMECFAVIEAHRQERRLYAERRKLEQSQQTRGKVLASLGMRRSTHDTRYASPSAQPSENE